MSKKSIIFLIAFALSFFCGIYSIAANNEIWENYGTTEYEGIPEFDGVVGENEVFGVQSVDVYDGVVNENSSLQGSSAGDNGLLQRRLERVLGSNEFDGASVSILAVTIAGDTLLCYDAQRQCIPASNLKLITTGLALHSLGSDYRFGTSIGYRGLISDGVLHGDLYIIGGGDPTLGSHNKIAEPFDSVLARWLKIVKDAGIEKIDGYIIGDGRAFPGMMEQESWQLNDSGTYYGAGVSGLTFYENELDFRVSPGNEVGSPLDIKPVYPSMPWMTFSYPCTTGKADSGNSLYFYTTNFAPFGEMRGTLAVNRKTVTESAANKFPEYTVANYFYEYLQENGVECTMRPADLGYVFRPQESDFIAPSFVRPSLFSSGSDSVSARSSEQSETEVENQGEITAARESAVSDAVVIIGTTYSPSLLRIVGATNHESNNMYAETLLKTLGMESAGAGTYSAAYTVENQLLAGLGLRDKNVKIRDGSGLSRENHVSAEFMCAFLKAMTASPAYSDFIGSLPYPGSDGTLRTVLGSAPADTKLRIRMKSGSMGGVRCFSGYILPATVASSSSASAGNPSFSSETSTSISAPTRKESAAVSDDTIVFSILVNNFSVSTSAIQRKIEEILLLLAE